MANRKTDAAVNLGKNIEALRRKLGFSQAQLANLAEVPRSTVTYMESGMGNPSLSNLVKISAALQVSIEELLSQPRANVKKIVAPDIPVLKKSGGAVLIYKLLPDPIPGMEIDRLEMKPSTRMGGTPHTHSTKEYLTCIRGSVDVTVNKQIFELKQGDVLAFPADQPHSYFNPGKTENLCISVVSFAR